jgi:hypothetical protein
MTLRRCASHIDRRQALRADPAWDRQMMGLEMRELGAEVVVGAADAESPALDKTALARPRCAKRQSGALDEVTALATAWLAAHLARAAAVRGIN